MTSWPEDFLSRDSGQLLLHPEYAPRFQQQGWTSTLHLLQATFSGTLLRRRDAADGWDNVRWHPFGNSPHEVLFVKRHRSWNAEMDLSLVEARAVGWCQQAGVPCMDIAAVGLLGAHAPALDGRMFHSFFISPQVGAGLTATARLEQIVQTTGSSAEIERVLSAVANTAAKLHSADLYHGDCHFPHFLLEDQQGQWIARLIDLQGTQQAARTRAYYLWLKDMGQLRHSLIRLGLFRSYANHWYESYRAAAHAEHIRRWLDRAGRSSISFRGDLRLFRRVVASAAKLDFNRAQLLLRDRLRAA